jgi:hypothetical protein
MFPFPHHGLSQKTPFIQTAQQPFNYQNPSPYYVTRQPKLHPPPNEQYRISDFIPLDQLTDFREYQAEKKKRKKGDKSKLPSISANSPKRSEKKKKKRSKEKTKRKDNHRVKEGTIQSHSGVTSYTGECMNV